MKFEWDAAKATANLRKHSASFDEGATVFLGACRAWGVEAKIGPGEDRFCQVRRLIAEAMGQEAGEKWTAAVNLQPTLPKSDRLLDQLALSGADPDHSVGESRYITFGMSSLGRLLAVSHTHRPGGIRIVSARRVTRAERKIYEEG